MTKCSC